MKKLIRLAILALVTGNAFATTYYVATTGSDSNPGDVAQPWRTLQHAANTVVAGDTVIVEDGTYVEAFNISGSGHTGTASAPIVFKSQSKWGAKIAPTSTSGNSNYTFYFSHVNYVTLQDFEVTGTTTTAIGIKIDSGNFNTIKGNNVHDIGVSTTACTSGAAIGVADSNNTISGNYVHNIGPPRTASFRCNQQHAIYCTDGCINVTFQNNIIFEIWQGYAFHLNGTTLTGNVVTNNTVFNVGDTPHNSGGPFILDCHTSCDSNEINNNIFANTGGGGCIWEVQESGATIGTHNLYYNNDEFTCSTGNGTPYIWVTGSANHTGTQTGDPLFVNYTGTTTGDYHLQATSAAIHNATAIGAATTDYDGVPRPKGVACDIGAYEFVASAPPNAPTNLVATPH
jgi:hypothetical protein